VSSTTPMAPYQPVLLNLPTPSNNPKLHPSGKAHAPSHNHSSITHPATPLRTSKESKTLPPPSTSPPLLPHRTTGGERWPSSCTLGKNILPELVFASKHSLLTPRLAVQKGMSVPIHANEPINLCPAPESKKQEGGRPRNLMLGLVPTPMPTTQYAIRGTTSLDLPRQQATFGQMEVEWGRRENEGGWRGSGVGMGYGGCCQALRELR